MLIAQISDTHIVLPDSAHPKARQRSDNLRRVVADINDAQPDLVVFTGDLVHNGAPAEYEY